MWVSFILYIFSKKEGFILLLHIWILAAASLPTHDPGSLTQEARQAASPCHFGASLHLLEKPMAFPESPRESSCLFSLGFTKQVRWFHWNLLTPHTSRGFSLYSPWPLYRYLWRQSGDRPCYPPASQKASTRVLVSRSPSRSILTCSVPVTLQRKKAPVSSAFVMSPFSLPPLPLCCAGCQENILPHVSFFPWVSLIHYRNFF